MSDQPGAVVTRLCAGCRRETEHEASVSERVAAEAEFGRTEIAGVRTTVAVCSECGFRDEYDAAIGHDGRPLDD